MNKKEIAQQFTRDCQSFSEGRKQMLDPNQSSISFQQVTNMLKEIEQTHSKIMSNTEPYRIQYRMLESLYSGLHSKIATLTKADREFGRAVDNVINRVIKIPKVLPLATLLDRYSGGNNIVAYNEHNLATTPLAKKRKKKKEETWLIIESSFIREACNYDLIVCTVIKAGVKWWPVCAFQSLRKH